MPQNVPNQRKIGEPLCMAYVLKGNDDDDSSMYKELDSI